MRPSGPEVLHRRPELRPGVARRRPVAPCGKGDEPEVEPQVQKILKRQHERLRRERIHLYRLALLSHKVAQLLDRPEHPDAPKSEMVQLQRALLIF